MPSQDDLPEPPAAGAAAPHAEGAEGGAKKKKNKKKKGKAKPKVFMLGKVSASGPAGRTLVATRDIRAGEVVLREPALAFAVRGAFRFSACYCCGADSLPTEVMLACEGCNVAHFCSETCRELCAPAHADLCAATARLDAVAAEHDCDADLLAGLLALLRVRAGQPWPRPAPADAAAALEEVPVAQWHDFTNLVSHQDASEPGFLEAVRAGVAALLEAVPEALRVSEDEAVGIACRINANAHAMGDVAENARAGLGLFPAVAMINHSCASNCLYTSLGHRMTVRAVQDVAQGEELTISYTPVYKSAAERRALLRSARHFDCACPRCESEEFDEIVDGRVCACGVVHRPASLKTDAGARAPACGQCDATELLVQSSDAKAQVAMSIEYVQNAMAGNDVQSSAQALSQATAIALRWLSPQHALRLALYTIAIDIARRTRDTTMALAATDSAIGCLENGVMPPNTLGLANFYVLKSNLVSAGLQGRTNPSKKLVKQLTQQRLAALARAAAIRAVCLGPDHSLVRDVEAVMAANSE